MYMDSSSNSSKISTRAVEQILEQLKSQTTRSSTAANYHSIWKKFNEFLIQLDKKPRDWEDRVSLYGAYLVHNGVQSSTLRSYVSAIKAVLILDNYQWRDEKVWLGTLTKACKIVNDQIKTRLPIQCNLLEMILFEIQRSMVVQPYLEIMYKAKFIIGYYGLFRVGELALGCHSVRAKNVHIGQNVICTIFFENTWKRV